MTKTDSLRAYRGAISTSTDVPKGYLTPVPGKILKLPGQARNGNSGQKPEEGPHRAIPTAATGTTSGSHVQPIVTPPIGATIRNFFPIPMGTRSALTLGIIRTVPPPATAA